MTNHKTVVLGASPNPDRVSNQAILLLESMNYPVQAVGIRAGQIGNTPIQTDNPMIADIDTLSLYIGKERQAGDVMDYILSLAPKRVIFNPGTEHPASIQALHAAGIATELACTLVLLRTGQYLPTQLTDG